jgi:hypothetical protein
MHEPGLKPEKKYVGALPMGAVAPLLDATARHR